MTAKILVLDIETSRAIVETFSLWKPFIGIDRVIMDSRILCFAAKWRDSDKAVFKSSWADGDEDSYRKMLQAAWDLLDSADFVVTWNGDRFDNQWLEGEFVRLGMPRPAPYKSLDLIKVLKRHFKQSLLSMKLDWSARLLLGDKKTAHGGSDLWHDIRYGKRSVQRAAQAKMREYNIQDVVLTGQILEKYLPWTNINLALYEAGADDELLHCTKCNSTNLHRRGSKFYHTTAFTYYLHRCNDCGATSRGKRAVNTTQLRTV